MSDLPQVYQDLRSEFPELGSAYDAIGDIATSQSMIHPSFVAFGFHYYTTL